MALLAATSGCSVTAAVSPLGCTLTAPAAVRLGEPVLLQWQISNRGPQALQLLVWGTPFEGAWTAPYVTVFRGAEALRYQGAMRKRGDPAAADYLRLAPGQALQTTVGLAPAFSLDQPGRYRIEPRLQLHDVSVAVDGVLPRPRAQHTGQALACQAVEVNVLP